MLHLSRWGLFLFVVSCFGQQQVFQATAAQGDGSTCTGIQNPTPNVNLVVTCTAPVQGVPTGSYHIFQGGSRPTRVPVTHTVQLGDVLCMFGVNPTNYVVSFPNLTVSSAPPFSLVYDCATTIRTANVVTGNAPGPSGVVTWTPNQSVQRSFWHRLFHPFSS